MLRSLTIFAALIFTLTANANGGHLFVLFGGYDTCPGSKERSDRPLEKMTLWEPFERLVLRAADQEGRTQRYILACYGATQGRAQDRSLYFRIRRSDGVEQKTLLAQEGKPFRAEDFETVIRSVESAIEEAAQVHGLNSVTLLGHSYGGWTLAEASLRIRSDLSISLFTVDPISPESCSPYLYRNSGLRIPSGCREAPAEWSRGTLGKQILSATQGRWWNLYQDQFVFNHSGPVEALSELGQNQRIKVGAYFRSGFFPWHYHALIARDPETWRWILEMTAHNSESRR